MGSEAFQYEKKSLIEYCQKSPNTTLNTVTSTYMNEDITSKEFKKLSNEKHKERWYKKGLHGQFMRELPEDTNQILSFDWLKSNSKKQTEAKIIAAQDHSLLTRSILSKFNDISPKCRLYNEKPKHLLDIVSACSYLASYVTKNVTTELQCLFIIL